MTKNIKFFFYFHEERPIVPKVMMEGFHLDFRGVFDYAVTIFGGVYNGIRSYR